MSKIITFSDRKPSGTFAQIRLDDGKRILVSFTQTEIVIFKLTFGGTIPRGKIFKHDISEFLDFFCVRVEQIGVDGSLLEAVVRYILPSKNIEDVVGKMNAVVEGCNDPTVKTEVQQKLQKQVYKLFADIPEKKIKIADFIKSIVDMTLETSVLGNKERGSKKVIEDTGKFKLEGSNITELLIAEIFVSQIPLNKFLKSKNKSDLLGLYFSEIYYLLLDKYKYFKFEEELKLFEILIQQRFPGYYKILNDPKADTFVALGGEVFRNLTSNDLIFPLFPITLGMFFSSKMIAINDFIKEISEKFEIEINL